MTLEQASGHQSPWPYQSVGHPWAPRAPALGWLGAEGQADAQRQAVPTAKGLEKQLGGSAYNLLNLVNRVPPKCKSGKQYMLLFPIILER